MLSSNRQTGGLRHLSKDKVRKGRLKSASSCCAPRSLQADPLPTAESAATDLLEAAIRLHRQQGVIDFLAQRTAEWNGDGEALRPNYRPDELERFITAKMDQEAQCRRIEDDRLCPSARPRILCRGHSDEGHPALGQILGCHAVRPGDDGLPRQVGRALDARLQLPHRQ